MKCKTSVKAIDDKILFMRGLRVMLDKDLAELYQVKPFVLRQQVKRNKERFPADFMFQLSREEAESMVSQNVIPSRRSLGGHLPYAFTQEGVAMLSSVLRSPRAVRVNIEVMRAFVRLKRMTWGHAELTRRINKLEQRYEGRFKIVFEAIRGLMQQTEGPRRHIGFKPQRKENKPT